MYVYDTDRFPCVEFGAGKKRQVRLVFSPDIGNAAGVTVVTASVPPGGVSEGHVHPECDEIIHFDSGGCVIMDGVSYEVPANGFVFAPKGCTHECVNTDDARTLQLLCIFVPPLKPYGKYPELIDATKAFFERLAEGKGGEGV